MSRVFQGSAGRRLAWALTVVLSLVVAACKGSGGTGY
jgi:hypothetical protein